MDEVRTLSLSPQKVAKNRNCRLINKFPHISVIDKASNFTFSMQLGFAEAHHKIPPDETVGVALG